MSQQHEREHDDFLRWRRWSLVVGTIAAIVCVIGLFFDPAQFFHAYAFTYFFVLGFPLGGLVLVMVHHLTGGVWGLLIRRIAEAQMRTLPLAALLFVPIGFGLAHIYLWADPDADVIGKHQVVQAKYLQSTFFLWRAAGYFLVWLVLVFFLSRWSKQQDATGDVRIAWKCTNLSGPGLVIFGITLHFAAIDWIMSIESHFTSTIFGPLVFSGQLLSAFALALVVLCCLVTTPKFREIVSDGALTDLGSLLFTMLVLWAYMSWFQFMLIWMADLPRGNAWYLTRLRGGWKWLALAVILLHFVVPFFLLLLRAVKCTPRALGGVAAWLLLMHLVYMYLKIMPVFDAGGIGNHWMDAVMPFALGGIWLFTFLWLLQRRPILPLHDLNYDAALELRSKEIEETSREEALAHG